MAKFDLQRNEMPVWKSVLLRFPPHRLNYDTLDENQRSSMSLSEETNQGNSRDLGKNKIKPSKQKLPRPKPLLNPVDKKIEKPIRKSAPDPRFENLPPGLDPASKNGFKSTQNSSNLAPQPPLLKPAKPPFISEDRNKSDTSGVIPKNEKSTDICVPNQTPVSKGSENLEISQIPKTLVPKTNINPKSVQYEKNPSYPGGAYPKVKGKFLKPKNKFQERAEPKISSQELLLRGLERIPEINAKIPFKYRMNFASKFLLVCQPYFSKASTEESKSKTVASVEEKIVRRSDSLKAYRNLCIITLIEVRQRKCVEWLGSSFGDKSKGNSIGDKSYAYNNNRTEKTEKNVKKQKVKEIAASFVLSDIDWVREGFPLQSLTGLQPDWIDTGSIEASCCYDYLASSSIFSDNGSLKKIVFVNENLNLVFSARIIETKGSNDPQEDTLKQRSENKMVETIENLSSKNKNSEIFEEITLDEARNRIKIFLPAKVFLIAYGAQTCLKSLKLYHRNTIDLRCLFAGENIFGEKTIKYPLEDLITKHLNEAQAKKARENIVDEAKTLMRLLAKKIIKEAKGLDS